MVQICILHTHSISSCFCKLSYFLQGFPLLCQSACNLQEYRLPFSRATTKHYSELSSMAIQNLTNTQHNGWVYLPYYPNGWVYLPSQCSISCSGFLSHFILILRAHALQCYIPLYLTTCPFSCFWSLLLFFFLFVWLFVFNK